MKLSEMIKNYVTGLTEPVSFDDIRLHFPDASINSLKKHIRDLMDADFDLVEKVQGVYPSALTVIKLAEKRLGQPVAGDNLELINVLCKSIVDSVTRPMHEKFIMSFMGDFIENGSNVIRIDSGKLVDFCYEKYVQFVHERDNGIVSIAGSMNEWILIRALENAGLKNPDDFKKTGKDSEGDLQVEHHGKLTKILFCEIKSYAARERLLRGLQDIKSPLKVGVGFFNNASEFNPDRTQTLLAAGPLAIYMPDATWHNLPEGSQIQTTIQQSSLYRPLSRYVSDMVTFRDVGELPRFNSVQI